LTDQRLRIGVIAPPYFSLPPTGYGGVEAVVSDLVDGLVDLGHEITLVGAGKHLTKAQRFLPTYNEPPSEQLGEPLPEVTHAARAAQLMEPYDFDLIHDHTLGGPLLARGRSIPTIVTVHGPVSGECGDYYRALGRSVRLVAISASQMSGAPDLPWLATVPNAIQVDTFPFQADKDRFALFLGRFHPHKAPHLAIDAARAAGLTIVLAGKCSEPIERQYFNREINPRLGPDVLIFGVADAAAKRDLLARATCLLFPICWEEPFGLVMIEAMACGTPVVALRRGAVPEVVIDGVTGIIVNEPAQLPNAIRAARELDPQDCRNHVERNFSPDAMAASYVAAYRRLLKEATRWRDGKSVLAAS
jgi:glycosyltransferase involved in cell wall biosynthesis